MTTENQSNTAALKTLSQELAGGGATDTFAGVPRSAANPKPQGEQQPEAKPSGLAHEDPWDRGEVQQRQQVEDGDPFEKHRRAAAHQLQMPTSAMSFGNTEGWEQ